MSCYSIYPPVSAAFSTTLPESISLHRLKKRPTVHLPFRSTVRISRTFSRDHPLWHSGFIHHQRGLICCHPLSSNLNLSGFGHLEPLKLASLLCTRALAEPSGASSIQTQLNVLGFHTFLPSPGDPATLLKAFLSLSEKQCLKPRPVPKLHSLSN